MTPLSQTLKDEQMVALVEAGPLRSAQQVADFLDGTDEERANMIANERLRGQAVTVSAWDKFLAVLNVVMTVAGVVTGISAAITGAYAVKTL